MKALSWIALGAAAATLIYLIVNAQDPAYSTGDANIDSAAAKTGLWGGKQRLSGTGDSLLGKVKQGFGEATGNERLANSGALDQAAGTVKDTVGKAATAVGEAIHNLNR